MIFSNLDSWKSVLEQAKDNSKQIFSQNVNAAKTFEHNSRELNAAAKDTISNSNTNETPISNITTTSQQQQSNKKI
jgi:hypothetical protein